MAIKWHEPRIVDDKWMIDAHNVDAHAFSLLAQHPAIMKTGKVYDYADEYCRLTFRPDVVVAHTSTRCVWWVHEDVLTDGAPVKLTRQWELAIMHAQATGWQGSDYDEYGRAM